jgi:hypothetical protein
MEEKRREEQYKAVTHDNPLVRSWRERNSAQIIGAHTSCVLFRFGDKTYKYEARLDVDKKVVKLDEEYVGFLKEALGAQFSCQYISGVQQIGSASFVTDSELGEISGLF